jgi:hypothetical protein
MTNIKVTKLGGVGGNYTHNITMETSEELEESLILNLYPDREGKKCATLHLKYGEELSLALLGVPLEDIISLAATLIKVHEGEL